MSSASLYVRSASLRQVLIFPSRKNAIEPLINLGVDGIITDYPSDVRVQLERNGKYLAPKADYKRVMGCLKAMNQVTKDGLSTKGF